MTTNNPDAPPRMPPCGFCANITPRGSMLRTGLKVKRDPVAYLEPHCWIVLCLDCGACGPNKETSEAAIEAWSRRASLAPAGQGEVWDEAIRVVRSVYMTREPLTSPDREHYATWQTAVTNCEKALEAARATTPSPAPDAPHSLADCIARVANVERLEKGDDPAPDAIKRGREMFAAELLKQLDIITSTTAAYHLVHSLCRIEVGLEPDSLGAIVETETHHNG